MLDLSCIIYPQLQPLLLLSMVVATDVFPQHASYGSSFVRKLLKVIAPLNIFIRYRASKDDPTSI